ncbi:MAG: glycosyltransferase family 4 protein [bacterium]
MRIAFITHYTSLYGANRSLLDLIDGLERHGVSSSVVCPEEGDMTAALRGRGVPVATMPVEMWMSGCSSPDGVFGHIRRCLGQGRRAARSLYLNVRVLPAFVRQLRTWDVDVVYTNSSVIPIGALAAKWLALPHIWHLREFGDLDYGRHPDWGTIVFNRVIRSADALVTNSEAVRSHVLNGAAYRRAYVIYNGIAWEADFDRLYELVQGKRTRQERYTFALVGYLRPSKGQETAIRALAVVADQCPDVRLLIVGGGDTSQLERIASQLGVADNVKFWGYIPNPYEAYLAANAALMCSKHEAMGRVTAEAMSACRPVIGYDDGGTPEIVEHEHTGLLYRGGPEALATCMNRFIENPAWAEQLGENGWHVARERYSIETYADSVYQVLQTLPI